MSLFCIESKERVLLVIMDNQQLPQSIGVSILPPSSPTPSQEELCRRLDELHTQHRLKTKPSDMFRGAVFATKAELRANPDWVSQAAHSLREILYPFGAVEGVPNQKKALEAFGSVRTDGKLTSEVGRIYGSFSELAHHGNCRGNSIDFTTFKPVDFEKLLADFERVMLDVLARQVDVHNEIDELFS